MARNSIAADASKLTLSKSITYGITLATSMILSRTLSLAEYGTYSQIQVAGTLILSVFSMGMPECSSFFLSRDEDPGSRLRFLSTYYTLNTSLGILAGAAAAALAPAIAGYFRNPAITGLVYVLAVYPWMNIIINTIDNILVVYRRTSKLMAFRISSSILLLAVILVTWLFRLSFRQYMALFVGADSLCALAVYAIIRRLAGRLRIRIDRTLLKNIVRFSVPLGLAGIVGTISIQLDKLMISKYFDTEQLAVFTNAAQEMPITIISSAMTAVLMPRIVRLLDRRRYEDAVELWGHVIRLVYALFCFFVSLFIVFAPQIITLLYSDKYSGGTGVFRVYCLVSLLRMTYFGMILNCIGKTRFILYSSVASLALNFGLNFLCYYAWGFVGPAVATFLCILVINVIQLVFTCKCISIPFRKIFPWGSMLRITLLNAAIASAVFALSRAGAAGAPVLAAVWAAAYGLLSFRYLKKQWKTLNESEG